MSAPCCSIERSALIALALEAVEREADLDEARQQWLFERACARELMGEVD